MTDSTNASDDSTEFAGTTAPYNEPLGSGFDPTDPNSPLAPFYMQVSHILLFLVISIYLFFANLTRPTPAAWLDLKYGQWITQNGKLPEREPFSTFSEPHAPSLRSDWLAQVIEYGAYRLGENRGGNDPIGRMEAGLEMLRGLHVALSFAIALLLIAAYRRASSLPLSCLGLVLLLPAAPLVFGHMGTEQFGLVSFAFVLAALSRPELSRRGLVIIPLVFAFWANTHPSFLIGLVLVAGFVMGRAIEVVREQHCWFPWRILNDRPMRRLLVALSLGVAASFANPYGPDIYARLIDVYSHPNTVDAAGWTPLDFSTGKLFPLMMLTTYVLLLASQAISPRAFTPTQMVLILSIGLLPLWKTRLMVWWLMLVPWLLLPQWAAALEPLKWRWLSYRSVPSFRKTIAVILMSLLLLAVVGPANWLVSRKARSVATALPADTPWRVAAQLNANSFVQTNAHEILARRLREAYPDGRFTGVILTTETTGDYLTWALPDNWPVMIHDELWSFPATHWADCQALYNARPDWWERLDRLHVNLIVVERERARRLTEALPKDTAWEILPDRVDSRGQGIEGPLLIAIRRKPIHSTPQS